MSVSPKKKVQKDKSNQQTCRQNISSRRGFSRDTSSRIIKRKFYIFCEGERTEYEYFKEISNLFRRTNIEIIVSNQHGVPKTLTDMAIKQKEAIRKSKDSFEKDDQVWVVFDRDAFPCYHASMRKCQEHDIGVAFSNPCFELWLLLHVEAYSGYNRPQDRKVTQKEAEEHLPKYKRDKHKSTDFASLIQNILLAIERAHRLLIDRESEGSIFGDGVPSTSVHYLIMEIKKEADKILDRYISEQKMV